MIVVKEALCLRGGKINEDRMGWGESFAFVIDGASGLTPSHVTLEESDAAWIAEQLRIGLSFCLSRNMEITDALKIISREMQINYDRLWKEKYHSEPDYPTAGLAIVRQWGDSVECFSLGDCTVTVACRNGAIKALKETELTRLDQEALAEMTEVCKRTGCTMLEARKIKTETLIRNRRLHNKPGGYWIFDPAGKGIEHGQKLTIPLREVESISAMTDGFAQLIEPFGIAESTEELHRMICERGLSELCGELLSLQKADADCSNYPRFKMRDDMTALFLKVRSSVVEER